MALNLSLLSLRLRRSVAFDPASETIPAEDRQARALLFPEYRSPWGIPAEYQV